MDMTLADVQKSVKRRQVLVVVALAGALLHPGCADSGTDAPDVLGQLTLGEALVRVGSDQSYGFHNVVNVMEDRHGRLIVVQLSNPEIPVFDAQGQLLTVLGGSGSGPGEFSYPGSIGTLGDSIWITDPRLRKAVLYGPDLVHVRDVVPEARGVNVAALGPADRMLAYTSSGDRSEWFAVDGSNQRLLLAVEYGQALARFEFEGRHVTLLNPFQNVNLVISVPGSLELVALNATTPHIEMLHVGWNGDTLRNARLPVVAQDVTSSWYQELIAPFLESMSTPANADELRITVEAALPRPATAHILTRLSVGPDRTLWFGQRRQSSRRWHAVDIDAGAYLGYLDLTGRDEVTTGTSVYVWILEHDANDVQSLVKRPLIR